MDLTPITFDPNHFDPNHFDPNHAYAFGPDPNHALDLTPIMLFLEGCQELKICR